MFRVFYFVLFLFLFFSSSSSCSFLSHGVEDNFWVKIRGGNASLKRIKGEWEYFFYIYFQY